MSGKRFRHFYYQLELNQDKSNKAKGMSVIEPGNEKMSMSEGYLVTGVICFIIGMGWGWLIARGYYKEKWCNVNGTLYKRL